MNNEQQETEKIEEAKFDGSSSIWREGSNQLNWTPLIVL